MSNRIKFLAIGIAAALLLAGTGSSEAKDTIRLEWVIQGQFAGFIVAMDKGYYEDAGVDVELVPAGPDIKPAVTVAQGADTFGLGHPNQVIAARANDVPLVMVMQFGQSAASVYIARKDSGIKSVKDMPGHSVGLWFGGDEHEFLAMLDAAGVDKSKVTTIPQGFSVVPWLQGDYDVMQVTKYNELLEVYDEGIGLDDLVIMKPEDYGVAMISGGMFTTEDVIEKRPDFVQGVVNASMHGWKEAIADPEAAAKIVLKYNPELDLQHQINQIKAMADLICQGPTLEGKFGHTEQADYEVAQKIMLDAGLIEEPVQLEKAFTNAFVDKAPDEFKKVACQE